jgi:hypothetical protein
VQASPWSKMVGLVGERTNAEIHYPGCRLGLSGLWPFRLKKRKRRKPSSRFDFAMSCSNPSHMLKLVCPRCVNWSKRPDAGSRTIGPAVCSGGLFSQVDNQIAAKAHPSLDPAETNLTTSARVQCE